MLVLRAQLADALQEARRHRQEAGFALYRLDDHRRHRRRIDLGDERLFELADGEVEVLLLGHPGGGAIQLRHRQPHDVGGEGPEAALEQPVLAGQAEREQRAAVIAAFEAHHRRPPGELAGQLDCVLDRLGAAVGEDRLLGEVARSEAVEHLGQADHRLVGGDQRAGVQELLGLRRHRVDDRGRSVADAGHADAAGEVDEGVAVDVEDQGAVRPLDDDVGRLAEPGRQRRRPSREHRLGPRARHRRVQPHVAPRHFPRRTGQVPGGVEDQQRAVVVRHRVVQVVLEQRRAARGQCRAASTASGRCAGRRRRRRNSPRPRPCPSPRRSRAASRR